jgi:hypothetical protein
MIGYYAQDPKKSFELLLLLREFTNLWLDARSGKLGAKEKERFGRLVDELAGGLNVLPFRGWLLKNMLSRRPKLLPEWTGIPDAVDRILAVLTEYLAYVCDHIVWQNISQTPSTIDDYVKKKQGEETNGLIFEIIVRRWLKEVLKGYWLNVQNLTIPIKPKLVNIPKIDKIEERVWHSIELDAFSLSRFDNQYIAAVAEIKWRLNVTDDGKILDYKRRYIHELLPVKLKEVASHFKRFLGINVNYAEVALISNTPVTNKSTAIDTLYRKLSEHNVKFKEVRLYDLDDIYYSVKNSNHPLKGVVEYISTLKQA